MCQKSAKYEDLYMQLFATIAVIYYSELDFPQNLIFVSTKICNRTLLTFISQLFVSSYLGVQTRQTGTERTDED